MIQRYIPKHTYSFDAWRSGRLLNLNFIIRHSIIHNSSDCCTFQDAINRMPTVPNHSLLPSLHLTISLSLHLSVTPSLRHSVSPSLRHSVTQSLHLFLTNP